MARSRGNKLKPNSGSDRPEPVRFTIEFAPSARRQLADIPARFRAQIVAKIDGLKIDPKPGGASPVRGSPGAYRIKSGDYRIIYVIERERLIVMVFKIGDRKDVYEGL